METTLHIRTKVLPGRRVEVTAPELEEGDPVDVFLVPSPVCCSPDGPILEFLDSLPPGPRSYPTWEEIEQNFQEERDAWDR